MYNAVFKSDNGGTFTFSADNFVIFDIDGLSGISVDNSTSQGAGQIGVSLATSSVHSRTLTITGKIFNSVSAVKKQMRNVLAPFATGMLIFNNRYWIYCTVADAPTFAPGAHKGDFTLRLLCPYPFWRELEQQLYTIGEITKKFHFPINYSTPHRFGEKTAIRKINVINTGDIEADYILSIKADDEVKNPYVANVDTLEMVQFNTTIHSGEEIRLYRDNNGIIRCVLSGGQTEKNIMSALDENSTLFKLHKGDNPLLVTDDTGGSGINAQIYFYNVIVGVFDEE